MLSERGWAALGAALAIAILWALLGEAELLGIAVFLVASVALGRFSVRKGVGDVRVTRKLSATLVNEGDEVGVELTVRSSARRTLRFLTVEDEIEALGTSPFTGVEVSDGKPLELLYRIPCKTRGVYQVGPTRLTLGDPLAFAYATSVVGTGDRLVVHPAIQPLQGLPVLHGVDASLQEARSESVQRGGEDFFSLREYQTGDDLRRVHWPTTARRDMLMIRQFETPWEPQAFVVIDPRASVYNSPEAFETAIGGAASVIYHFFSAGLGAELWTGLAIPSLDTNPYEAAMTTLAGLQPLPSVDLGSAVLQLRRRGRGGTLAIVTGTPDTQILAVQRHLTRHAGATVLLTVSPTPPPQMFGSSGATVVSIRPGESWTTAWTKALSWTPAGVG